MREHPTEYRRELPSIDLLTCAHLAWLARHVYHRPEPPVIVEGRDGAFVAGVDTDVDHASPFACIAASASIKHCAVRVAVSALIATAMPIPG